MMHAIANSEECVPVTEGAGYIGSHVVSSPLEAGYKVVVMDNLSTGFREAMPGELPVKQLVLAWSASRADHLLDYRRRYHSDERLGTQVGEVTLRTDRADPRRHAGSRIVFHQNLQRPSEFIKGMLGAISEKDRKHFVGTP